jgi:hypothetical protein
MHSYSQHQSNSDFQDRYFRFMYAIKSPETQKKVIMVEDGGNQTLMQDVDGDNEDEQPSIYRESNPRKDENYIAASAISQEQQQPLKTPNGSIESETANPSPEE